MKIDLDELWVAAQAGSNLSSGLGVPHLVKVKPEVLAALIARIRELEATLGGLVGECEERTENPGGDFYAEQREILAKGVVLT